tara:strand:+ start:5496 stop:6350 length:855 start_codon:yes stop_codon:yes gene_type:complete
MTSRYTPEEEARLRTKEWLKNVYKTELGREIGQEGLDYWTKDIHDSGQTRNQVLSNIRRSDEKWLGDTYKTELGRGLRDEGRDYWMNDMRNEGQTRDQVLANIRRSDEYKNYQGGADPDEPDPIVCGTGQELNSSGTGCVAIPDDPGPILCPSGQQLNSSGTGCVPFNEGEREDPIFNPNRPYNKYWDAIDAAADTGNKMTDDYYQRFLPQMRKEVMLGTDEIGASDRYHGSRYEGEPPDYTDPKDLFEAYRGGNSDDDDDDSNETISSLNKRLKELEEKYSIG